MSRIMDPVNFKPDFEIDPRVERARTLPSACYTDPSIEKFERRNIFARSWQLAGRLDQIPNPGTYFTTSIGSEPIVLVRDAAGEIRGFHNICRHRAGAIARGGGSCEKFRCSYHGWTYDLNGRLVGIPDFEGVEEFDRQSMGLIPIDVAIWEQFILVRLDQSANTSPSEILGDIPDLTSHCRISEMKFGERRDYLINCNWKVYVDNYVEGYHVPVVHPSLMREIDFRSYRTLTSRYHSRQDAPIRVGDTPNRVYNATDTQSEALYFWVFPNLMLNIYPDNISTNLIVPYGPDRTLTIFEWFFHDVESDDARRRITRAVELSDEIQQEDIAVCEEVQQRLGSAVYDRGRYSPKRENGLHHFHSLWMEWMKGDIER